MLIHKLKFIGTEATMVRPQRGGEKVKVQPEEILECEDKQALALLKAYPLLFASMGVAIDENALNAKREKAAAAQLTLKQRQELMDRRAAEKKAANEGGAEDSAPLEAPTYESVMEMGMEQLAKLNDAKKLGVKITKNAKVEAIRTKVVEALELEPVENANVSDDGEQGEDSVGPGSENGEGGSTDGESDKAGETTEVDAK